MKLIYHLLALAILATTTLAADPLDAAGKTLAEMAASGEITGIQAQIGDRNHTLLKLAAGHVGAAGSKAVDEQTMFCIGSCSKPLSSAVMLSLAEQGKFNLDAPVDQYLPAFGKLKLADGSPARTPKIWEILCHRAGFFSQKEKMTRVQMQMIRTYDKTLEQQVNAMAAQPLIAAPGERFAYSGAGYCVAGRAAEAALKTPFEKLLQARLAAPLGMKRTSYFPAPTDTNVAAGLVEEGGQITPDADTPHMLHDKLKMALIGGSLYSTAQDLGLFGSMVLNGGKTGGKAALGPAMHKKYTSRILPQEKYGFGWGVKVNNSGQTIELSHSGALASSRALIHIDLAGGKYGVVVYTLGAKNREAAQAKVIKTINGAMGVNGNDSP